MEFEKLIRMRQSTRKYQEKQILQEHLEKIIDAANRAPVGSNLYQDIHLTVVQDQNVLIKLCEAAWKRFSTKQKVEEIAGNTLDKSEDHSPEKHPNLFYGAPTVIVVSQERCNNCCQSDASGSHRSGTRKCIYVGCIGM